MDPGIPEMFKIRKNLNPWHGFRDISVNMRKKKRKRRRERRRRKRKRKKRRRKRKWRCKAVNA